ncbi:MAG TPA: deoxyhypusine synthase [Candidatus Nealsonbacteria bacterium]|nr:deoxyhypusine synthase [Candidatus Nealsonbacteria bacterium]HEB46646.1 deoxyhypusine synthase [Candidatus Nealsonbacteria bacterium]
MNNRLSKKEKHLSKLVSQYAKINLKEYRKVRKATGKYKTKKLEAINVDAKSISELLSAMAKTGFQGRKLGEVVDVWEEMIKDKNVTIIMGYAGSLSTTGQWKIINWLIEQRFIDVLVSTGANVSEDIIEGMGYYYYKGSQNVDDVKLLESDINRYYDVFGDDVEYLDMINLIAEFIMTRKEGYNYSTMEFLRDFGLWLNKRKIGSIIGTAAKAKVPVFSPALVDSAYGDAVLIAKSRKFNLILDQAKDYVDFMGLTKKVKDIGVIYIGGGVPKDFIQLLAVSSPLEYDDKKIPGRPGGVFRPATNEYFYPHKYAIQITTDSPQWGGLSGCTFEEATSWGKEAVDAKKAQCFCDATIALPIVTHALKERIKSKRKGTDFSSLFKKK